MKRKMLLLFAAIGIFVMLIASCGNENEFEDSSMFSESEGLTKLINKEDVSYNDEEIAEEGGSGCCDSISVVSELVPADEGCCAMQFTLVDPVGCATMNTTQHNFPTECVSYDNNGEGVITVTICCEADPGNFVRTVVTSPCQPAIVSDDWTDFSDCNPDCCDDISVDFEIVPSPIGCCSGKFTLNDPGGCGATLGTVQHFGFGSGCLSINYIGTDVVYVTSCCVPGPGAFIQVPVTSDCDPAIVSQKWVKFKGCSI